MSAFLDLSGKVFGKWTIIARDRPDKKGAVTWKCRCECGRVQVIGGHSLRNTKTSACRSCAHKTGDKRKVPEFNVWESMLRRCDDYRHKHYKDYGGRGIKVCERWSGAKGYANFIADMGPRPSKNHSIDRIDNNKGYSPGNCRWADCKTQQRNRRNNRMITAFGLTLCLAEWAEKKRISEDTIAKRLNAGWPVEKALTIRPLRLRTDNP